MLQQGGGAMRHSKPCLILSADETRVRESLLHVAQDKQPCILFLSWEFSALPRTPGARQVLLQRENRVLQERERERELDLAQQTGAKHRSLLIGEFGGV